MTDNHQVVQPAGPGALDPMAVIQELERSFPKELQIAMQSVYIRQLEARLAEQSDA